MNDHGNLFLLVLESCLSSSLYDDFKPLINKVTVLCCIIFVVFHCINYYNLFVVVRFIAGLYARASVTP